MKLRAAELLDADTLEDPYPLFARLRAEAPVAQIDDTGVWMVTSWARVEEAVLRDDDFSANLTGLLYTDERGDAAIFDLGAVAAAAGAVIATADEPDHAVHRAAVAPGLVAREIAQLESAIRQWTGERTQQLVREGGGDYVAAVAEAIPTRVVARLLEAADEDLERLQRWGMTGGDMLAGTTTPAQMAALGVGTGEMAAYLAAKLGETAPPPPGPPSLMARLRQAVHDGLFPEPVAVGIAVTLVGAGVESTASLIGSALRLLAERPGLQRTLRREPAKIGRFVEEALRLESPFRFHYRVVKRACRLGDAELQAGDRLMLAWSAANRDESEFERPDEIDLGRRYPKRHLGFGRGRHFCVGAHLARLEARVAVDEMLERSAGSAEEGAVFGLDPAQAPRHTPSIFVRRLESLPLRFGGARASEIPS